MNTASAGYDHHARPPMPTMKAYSRLVVAALENRRRCRPFGRRTVGYSTASARAEQSFITDWSTAAAFAVGRVGKQYWAVASFTTLRLIYQR